MKKTAYIYLNAKESDGTVFVTQVADWLKLYTENGIDFKYFHLLFYRKATNRRWRNDQLTSIKSVLPNFKNYSYSFPSRGLFIYLNAYLWAYMLKKEIKNYDKVVIFSRMMYGKEIKILKKILKKPVYFIYDSRAASVEENKYNAVKKKNLSKYQFNMFSHISYTEWITVNESDKIFCVSKVLKKYLMLNYGASENKFFIYPCLSDARKFYFSDELRTKVRKELGYTNNLSVYLYAGGLYNEYHVLDDTVIFLNKIAEKNSEARFMLLSRDTIDKNEILTKYPALNGKFINMAVPNCEMVKYLNAADYGILFRENVPMNNVASPSKFAEYALCGLPTIISEGIGDYSSLCKKENLGIMILEEEMKDINNFDFNKLDNLMFNRNNIAEYAYNNLSKQARLSSIINEFKKADNEL